MARSRRSNRTISPRRVLYTVAAVVALVAGSFVAGFVLGQQVPMPVSAYFEAPESFEPPSMAIEAPSLDPNDAPHPDEARAPVDSAEDTAAADSTPTHAAAANEVGTNQRVLAREPAPTERRIVYASGQ